MDNNRQKNVQTIAIPLTSPKKTGEGFGFIAYANSRVEKLWDEGRYDAANKLKMYLRRFIAYLGKNEVPFKDFDALLMRNYHTWLKNQELGRNTISLYIRNLKRVYRLAVDDGLAADSNPFEGMDVSYRVKKERNGLTLDEVKRLRDLDLSGEPQMTVFARDIFLFTVYARGMRSDDIFRLTRSNIRNGLLTYRERTAHIPPAHHRQGNLHSLGTSSTRNNRPLQAKRHDPPLSCHHGKILARAMDAIRRHSSPHQLQPEETWKND